MASSEENLEYEFRDAKGIYNPIFEGDHKDVKTLNYDGKRLKWERDFNGLKKFIKNLLAFKESGLLQVEMQKTSKPRTKLSLQPGTHENRTQ